MENKLGSVAVALVTLILCTNCRQVELAPRNLTPEERFWQESLQKWYPAWQPPYLSPLRKPGGHNDSGEPLDLEKVPASPADLEPESDAGTSPATREPVPAAASSVPPVQGRPQDRGD